ncbi:MAG: cell division protein FtsA [Patescibacteria group bacterium]
MARQIAVGLDIGSYQIKVVVSEDAGDGGKTPPRIIGTGMSESRGLHHGYIVNVPEASQCIKDALREAEKTAGNRIRRVFLGVGGIGLEAVAGQGSAIVSRGDNEVTELDLEKVRASATQNLGKNSRDNRRIIQSIALGYKLDGKDVYGRPVGMRGVKLEGKFLFITFLNQHFEDMREAIEAAGAEIEDATASPIAASLVSLTKQQKAAGCVLANIGSETTSILVFDNGLPISLEVLPIGANAITNDIALGLRIPLEEAEQLKRGAITGYPVPKKKLEDIIAARLSDIFDLIEAHLKKIDRNGLLPAGIILTGGGGSIGSIETMAKAALRIPARIGAPFVPSGGKTQIKDGSWAVAYGLSLWGLSGEETSMGNPIKALTNMLEKAVRPFLP